MPDSAFVGANLADLVENAAVRRPDHTAVISGGRRTSWCELNWLVRAISGGLTAAGLDRGDRVAVMLDNSLEYVTSYFGILRAGMVAVPINTGYTATEIATLLSSSGARIVITDASRLVLAREAAPDATTVVGVGTEAWRRLTVGSTPPSQEDTDPESLAVLLYTSGTSDQPRAAMLTHRAMIANLQQLARLEHPEAMRPDDVALVVLPLFHIYALNAALGMVAYRAATAVLVDRFEAAESLELIQRFGVTNVAGAPPMYIAWSSRPEAAEALAGIRILISGAAPLPASIFEQFATLGLTVWESYGMTEAAPAISSSMVRGVAKPGSVGAPLAGLEVRLLDADGFDVDDGDPGEIVVRGPNLFSGYWPDGSGGPADDGWWPTGDVAIRDDDGDLRLVDRTKELIIVSGFNVYPREIESALVSAPGVAEVAVAGVDHPYTGETVKAWVVPQVGATVTSEQVAAFGARRLARFKCPTIVEIVESLPHSANGKVSKVILRGLDRLQQASLVGNAVEAEEG